MSLSACCTFFTSSLPAALLAERLLVDMSEDPEEEEEDMPVSLDSLLDVPDLPPELRPLPTAPLVPL